MKKNYILSLLCVIIIGTFLSCASENRDISLTASDIHLNQIGYLPEAYKSAIFVGSADKFAVIKNNSHAIVYQGELSSPQYWQASGETVTIADFSSLNTPGTYRIQIAGQTSFPFIIEADIFSEIGTAGLKAYYFHRTSTPIEEQFAGIYARPSGHPDDEVAVHASAASLTRPEGTIISSPKGWYDAGDYNKYIVNSAISVSTMMSFYEHYPQIAGSINCNIPESNDETPDILDEIRWNLDWMLTMQDPEDGGVYHKLTSKSFGGMELPHLDTTPRWVVMKTTAATLDFAASMAQASRVYNPFDEAFADQCISAAKHAWEWAQSNPVIPYVQPEDIHTGAYDQSKDKLSDEFYWAAAELSITTGEAYPTNLPQVLSVPEWRNGLVVGLMNQIHHNPTIAARVAFLTLADSLALKCETSAYDVSNDSFRWGSNGDFLNQAMVLVYAFKITGTRAYHDAALSTFDWVLGKNPQDYSFVTGFGDKPPMHIHHRPSEGDGIIEPIPGWVAGGPNPENKNDCGEEAYFSEYPALAYLDQLCSYATNEVAINWNAPFVYVANALSAELGRD
ncbi:glycoside hydrolase family 9 protein [bacterium]|nr:glycoside hydrolase family 9 protein [bacterium]